MTVFTKLGNDVFSPVDAAGNPRSVENHDAQVWSTEVERIVNAFISNGGLIYGTLSSLQANLSPGAAAMAWVLGDPVAANNGIYQKIGASGSGSWVRRGDLPYSFIRATDAGAGTANAVQATTSIPIPAADGAALIALNIFENNTGPATVSFNGGPALTIKTNSGADVQADYLVAGMIVAGYVSGGTFRLISDVGTAADRAAAEQAAADAEAAKAAAEAAAAGVNLPSVDIDDAGFPPVVKDDGVGYQIPAPYAAGGASRKIYNRIRKWRDLYDFCENDPLTVTTEAADAWDRAMAEIATIGSNAQILIPAGDFYIDRTLLVPTTQHLEVICAAGYATRLMAADGAVFTNGAMFGPADAGILDNFRWRGGAINGRGIAQYGMRFPNMRHSQIDNPEVINTTAYALFWNGYSNILNAPKIYNNVGGLNISGVLPTGGIGNNNTKVNGGIIYNNSGIGFRLQGGWGVAVAGLGVEGNALAGLVADSMKGLHWSGGYFERNSSSGLTISDGPKAITPKADIFLLSNGASLAYSSDTDRGASGIVFDGCHFTPYGAGDFPSAGLGINCHIFANSLENLRVTNCDTWEADHVNAMVGLYNDNRNTNIASLVVEGNTINNIVLLGTPSVDFAVKTAHNVSNRFLTPINYAPQAISDYTIASGTTGTLTDSGADYGPYNIWTVTPGDKLWSYTLDLNAHPELKGKLVWFGFDYRVLEDDVCVNIYCGGNRINDGAVLEDTTPAGRWLTKSSLKQIGASDTSLVIAFRVSGGTTLGAQITAPRLAVVGVSAAAAFAA